MALFGRDYDRDYGNRGDTWNRGYDRSYRSGGGSYDRGGMTRDNRGWAASGYDRDMRTSGYDRAYKSRWQTDFGDPFGDRTARTPMRMIRGEYQSGYDRGFRGSNRDLERGNTGYGRDYYEANPMSYDPHPAGNRGGNRARGNRPYGRGYDAGWF